MSYMNQLQEKRGSKYITVCVDAALHLDVPVKAAWYDVFLYKLKWATMTLFAPEIALYMAADQLQQAWNLKFAHIPLVLSEQSLHRWDAILSTYPFHNREAFCKTASSVKVNHIAWYFETISPQDDAGPQAGQDLFVAQLPEFKPVLDPTHRTMPFSEGKRNLDINFNVFTESEGVFGLLGFFQQFPWLAGLALLLSGIYRGVHLSAWNWTFPNSNEHLMWKISCLYIAGALALYFIMAVFATAVRTEGTAWPVTYIAFWLALFVHMGARLYFVFESFFSLRRSLAGVYTSPA
ncbi:uncharacterized protein FOBCDRAFT_291340 [Fusarium oxysporum Fo47]|nr:uncharacterized protein FOBCDRAFT_291340 [Fusarium oxysporum Fo47]EWZ41417.1 hypothetical protein FOZG_06716 [Fusarium oxysporum Fo47]EXA01485.1 hypothetical protein FOWG_01329 [Fusarium oxysporum f. sp. lycopersici MN25]WJG35134.1 hypothetical protein FOBCDRAFT_291340 [Fusarium oxysporum Fo47]